MIQQFVFRMDPRWRSVLGVNENGISGVSFVWLTIKCWIFFFVKLDMQEWRDVFGLLVENWENVKFLKGGKPCISSLLRYDVNIITLDHQKYVELKAIDLIWQLSSYLVCLRSLYHCLKTVNMHAYSFYSSIAFSVFPHESFQKKSSLLNLLYLSVWFFVSSLSFQQTHRLGSSHIICYGTIWLVIIVTIQLNCIVNVVKLLFRWCYFLFM